MPEPKGRRPLARKRAQPKPGRDRPPVIYGLHAVTFALQNPARRIDKLQVTENAERRLADALAERGDGLAIERVHPRALDHELGADTVHQGVAADVAPLAEPELADLVDAAGAGRPIVLLDQVTDPHNVGAVLRSCAVFGAAGLVLTRRHSPPLDGALAKSASGALELVPVCLVQNLGRAIADIQSAGVMVAGLDGESETLLHAARFDRPTAIVLGAEGKGLRQSTREACDALVAIASGGPIHSLNVSNAAAIVLHELSRR
ncbi:MAG: 23S rRNA (guanosine(2251)-2'-O)-methyltransferase RlmB [Pseudomonadota bacterium]